MMEEIVRLVGLTEEGRWLRLIVRDDLDLARGEREDRAEAEIEGLVGLKGWGVQIHRCS